MAAFPRGVDGAVAQTLSADEPLVAATYAESFSASDDAMSMIGGTLGVKLSRKAGLSADAPPPLPGLAGTIYRGEVLVAVTGKRILVYPRTGKQVHPTPVWFEPGAIVSVSWARAVIGTASLYLRFGDNTMITLSLPSSNHGKQVARAGRKLLDAGRPR